MGQDILLDLISCGDTEKHPPDVGKNFAIKESGNRFILKDLLEVGYYVEIDPRHR